MQAVQIACCPCTVEGLLECSILRPTIDEFDWGVDLSAINFHFDDDDDDDDDWY